MKSFLVSGAAVAALIAGGAAIAQPAAQAPVRIQDRMDGTDQPARIVTRGEITGHVRTMFARLDSNRDGSITREEAAAARGHAKPRAAKASPQGHAERRSRVFERLDANRDGSISRAEWDARPAAAPGKRLHRAHDGVTTRRGLGLAAGGLRGRMFELADANRDGRVNLQEATTAALQHFDRVDTNRDGSLSPEERQQARQRFRAERQRG